MSFSLSSANSTLFLRRDKSLKLRSLGWNRSTKQIRRISLMILCCQRKARPNPASQSGRESKTIQISLHCTYPARSMTPMRRGRTGRRFRSRKHFKWAAYWTGRSTVYCAWSHIRAATKAATTNAFAVRLWPANHSPSLRRHRLAPPLLCLQRR
jgi:hypothetical protein